MKIDKLEIRIVGRMFIDQKLKPEQTVRIVIDGVVDGEEFRPNYDGSGNILYKIKSANGAALVHMLLDA